MVATYDEDGTGSVSFTAFALNPGQVRDTVDFGYVYPTGSIGDLVWEDSNSDGIKDFTE